MRFGPVVVAFFGAVPTFIAACGPTDGAPTGDGGIGPADSGASNWQVDAPAEPIPPAPARLDCPAGWLDRNVVGSRWSCEPFGDAGLIACPEGSMMVPGDRTCVPVGASCGTDRFPSTEGPTVFVDGLSIGGDGSAASPFPTISEALAAAADGATVSVAAGEYAEVLTIDRPVTLVGVCSAAVRLVRPDTSTTPLVNVSDAGTTLRNISLRVAGTDALRVEANATLEGIEVWGGRLLITGGLVTGDRLSIRSVSIPNPATPYDAAIEVSDGAQATLRNLAIVDTVGPGLRISGEGTGVTVANVLVDDVKRRDTPLSRGHGMVANGTGSLTVTRGVFQRFAYLGLQVNSSARVEVHESLFRDATPTPGLKGGYGFDMEGGVASVYQTVFDRTSDEAVRVDNLSRLHLEDVLIRDTQVGNDERGRSLVARDRATLTGSRIEIENGARTAVYVNAANRVELADLAVRWPAESGLGGDGVDTRFTPVTLNRGAFTNCLGTGILSRSGGELTLTDISVEGTRGDSVGFGGHGLVVQAGGSAVVQRGRFVRNRTAAVAVYDANTDARLEDILVEDTLGRAADGTFGTGILASGALLTLTRAALTGNRGLGLHLARGSQATLQHLTVRQTVSQACSTTSCPDMPFGYGIASLQQSTVTADHFEVSEASLCGVIVATDGQLDLSQGVVHGSSLGACVQTDAYDVGRLTNDVSYYDNGRNLDATSLPLPDAEPPPVPIPGS